MARGGTRYERIAGDVAAADAGVDGRIGGEVAAGYCDSKGIARADGAAVGIAVDDEIDGIAGRGVAADRAADVDTATGLGGVDDIVRCNLIDTDASRGHGVDGMCRCCRGAVGAAGSIGARQARDQRSVCGQVATGDRDRENVAGIDVSAVGIAVDLQTDAVARAGVAADRTGHVDRCTGFAGVDQVVGGNCIDGNRGRRNGAGGDRGRGGLVC